MTDRTWGWRAACLGMDTNQFFPIEGDRGGGGAKHVKEKAAKAVCARCPVRRACLDEALAIGDVYHGIRGGMTPYERRNKARRRARRVAA